MFLRRALVCCIAALWPGLSGAQQLFIRNYTQGDGLPTAQVFTAYQDSRSYLWFGTPGGLVRYNGSQLRTYSVDDGLLHDSVRGILEHRGSLYFVGEKGVTRFDRSGATSTLSSADGLGAGIVWRVVEHQGRLWFGTSSGGLSRLEGARRFKTFTTRDGLPGNNVFALLPDGERLWVGTRDGGLALLEQGRFRTIGPADGLTARQIMALDRVGDTLWVGTRDGGIFTSRDGKSFVRRLPDRDIYSVGHRGKELFFGTLGHGVIRIAPDGTVLRYTRNNGLAGDRVYAVLVDREGSIWFTTNAGISKLLSDKFVSYLPGTNVLALEEYGDRVWLGTLGQGLLRLDGGKATPVAAEQLGQQNIWSLRRFDGRLWIGTSTGLYSSDGTALVQHALLGAPGFDGIYDLVVVRGRLWLATTGGVCAYDHRNERCETYTVKRGLAGNVTYSGTAWRGKACFGAEGGISCIDGRGALTTYTRRDGLPSSTVYVVFTDSGGRLWAGTNRGLALWQRGRFRVFDRRRGLSHNLVTALTELDGRMLVCTNGGLNLLRDERVLRVYRQNSGLVSNDVNFSAVLVDRHDNVWMGTTRGVARYIPDKDIPNTVPPAIWIERVLVNGAEAGVRPGAALRLPWERRDVAFELAGLSFKDERNVAYSFQLVGYDRGWSPPAAGREVRYTNLSPGRYTFRARARNADGYWSSRPAALELVVLPPFWRTWWFVALCAALLALLVYLGFRLRVRHIRRDYQRLERVVEERTLQLREAAERLKDLSLTDPLTGLRNRRYLRELIGPEVERVDRLHQDVQRRPGQEHALDKAYLGFMLLDLDHFKEVNDQHGHDAGDALIRGYAARLTDVLRGSDAVIRWGGEEFLVVCREVNPESLLALCERVARQLRAEPFELPDGTRIARTCSLGFSTYPFSPAEPRLFNHETVINIADHAMYVAKRNGRDLVVGLVAGETPIPPDAREWVKRDIARGVAGGYLRVLVPGERELEL